MVSRDRGERVAAAQHPHVLRARHQFLNLLHRRRMVEPGGRDGHIARPVPDHGAILAATTRRSTGTRSPACRHRNGKW